MTQRLAYCYALSDGVPCRSFFAAFLVTTVLNLINRATRCSAQCLSIGSRSFDLLRAICCQHLWRRFGANSSSCVCRHYRLCRRAVRHSRT